MYRYDLKVGTKLTDVPGDIELWLSAISLNDNVVFKTNSVGLTVLPAKDIADYLDPKSRDQLDSLSAKVWGYRNIYAKACKRCNVARLVFRRCLHSTR